MLQLQMLQSIHLAPVLHYRISGYQAPIPAQFQAMPAASFSPAAMQQYNPGYSNQGYTGQGNYRPSKQHYRNTTMNVCTRSLDCSHTWGCDASNMSARTGS